MEKHSMRHLLWAALFLLYCACGCFGAVVQQLPQKGQGAWQAYTVSTKGTDPKSATEWQPIRIDVYTKYVEDIMKECLKPPEQRDSNVTKSFCDGENKMTTARMDTLFKEVLPEAIKLHRDRLKVQPVKGTLKLLSESKTGNLTGNCPQSTIPTEHFNEGVNNTDFMLYVGLSSQSRGVGICSEDPNGRPTSAVIKFIPKEIVATRQFIRLTAQEIAKGLGFTFEHMKRKGMIGDAPVHVNGEDIYDMMVVLSNTMYHKVIEHYGCVVYYGSMFFDRVNNTYLPYWERRVARDELMSPYTGEPTGMYYTILTLAAFQDLTFYRANFSMAEPMSWGHRSNCELIERACKTSLERLMEISNVFCKESEQPALQCTSDRFGLGVCSKDGKSTHGMPAEYHYFKTDLEQSDAMKECPIIKPFQETSCETGNETLMPGSIVSNISRCLNVENPEFNGGHKGNGVTVHGICAKVKCENGKVHVQYKGAKDSKKWHVCQNESTTIQLEGSVFKSGTIACPKYSEVCTGLPETKPFTIKYERVVVPEKEEENKEQSSSSTESEANSDVGKQNQTHKTDGNNDGHTDNSIAVSFFGPLMFLVCAVVAVVAL